MGSTIQKWIDEKGKLHFSLIDPDEQIPNEAGEMADFCVSCGTDAIMVGGSTVDFQKSQETTIAIKKTVSVPVILFPSCANVLNIFADCIFFMQLVNSISRKFLIEEQLKAVSFIRKYELECISVAYIIIKTGGNKTTVEEKVGALDIIANDIEKAVNYALMGKIFGFSVIYLEAGSGAKRPVSNEMIRAVREAIDIPIIVGGGIRDAAMAREKIKAGASVIVTGTIGEEDPSELKEIIKAIKSQR